MIRFFKYLLFVIHVYYNWKIFIHFPFISSVVIKLKIMCKLRKHMWFLSFNDYFLNNFRDSFHQDKLKNNFREKSRWKDVNDENYSKIMTVNRIFSLLWKNNSVTICNCIMYIFKRDTIWQKNMQTFERRSFIYSFQFSSKCIL